MSTGVGRGGVGAGLAGDAKILALPTASATQPKARVKDSREE